MLIKGILNYSSRELIKVLPVDLIIPSSPQELVAKMGQSPTLRMFLPF